MDRLYMGGPGESNDARSIKDSANLRHRGLVGGGAVRADSQRVYGVTLGC